MYLSELAMVRRHIAGEFFEALGEGGREGAFQYLNRTSFVGDVGPDGAREPSPRAQALINSGEWDSNRLLKLYRVDGDVCWGLLPTFSVVDGGRGYTRFCWDRECTVNSHSRQKVPVEERRSGWYLQAGGGANKGACLDFWFPFGPDGPIGERAASRLVGHDAMQMTHGQWRFLFDEFEAYRAEVANVDGAPDDGPQEGSDSPPVIEDASLSVHSAVSETKEQDPIDLAGGLEPDLNEEVDVNPPLRIDTGFDAADEFQQDDGDLEDIFGLRIADMFNQRDTRLRTLFRTQLTQVTDEMVAHVKRVREGLIARSRADLERHKADLEADLKEVLEAVAKRQKELEAQNAKLTSLNADLVRDRERLGREIAQITTLQSSVATIESKVDALEPPDLSRQGLSEDDLGRWETIKFEVLDERGSLSSLQSLVKTIREREAAGGDVTCHGMTFASDHQLNTWFMDRNLRIDCFHDARSLVNSITETVVTKDKSTKAVEAREKAHIR